MRARVSAKSKMYNSLIASIREYLVLLINDQCVPLFKFTGDIIILLDVLQIKIDYNYSYFMLFF